MGAQASVETKVAAAMEANATAQQALAIAEKAQAAAEKARAAADVASKEQAILAQAAKAAAEEAKKENEQYVNMEARIAASKCENNPACAALNVTGYCCPTLNGSFLNGTMLGCCIGSASAVF